MKVPRRPATLLGICIALSAAACDEADPVSGAAGAVPLAEIAGSGE